MDISPPLKPAVFHILEALAEADNYGYAIMQAVTERSGGHVPLRTGSFYRHLSRLMDSGLVVEAKTPSGVDVRRGSYYRVTSRGRQVLEAERVRLANLLAGVPGRQSPRRRHV